MGATGSGVAIETADIALMGNNLLKLPESISLAKRTTRVMQQNIFIALAAVVILLAGVFAGGVTMSLSMLVHEGSVLVVILNAMRLLRNNQPATALSRRPRPRKQPVMPSQLRPKTRRPTREHRTISAVLTTFSIGTLDDAELSVA